MKSKKLKTPAHLLTDAEASAPLALPPSTSQQMQAQNAPMQSLIGTDGKWYEFPSENINAAIDSGFRPPTQTELNQRLDEKEYSGGLVNTLEAGALGVLRGSSLGLSDVALRAVNPKWAETAAKLREYNPEASIAGEVGSFFIPGMVGAKAFGKAGQAVSKIGTMQKLVSEGAGGLGSVAKKIIGENLAGTAASSAVKLGTEAAVFRAAHNISEEALADHDLTAESILAGTGKAAIFGAGIGAALPVGFRAAQSAGDRLLEVPIVKKAIVGPVEKAIKFFDPNRSRALFSGGATSTGSPRAKLWGDTVEGTRFQTAVKELGEDGLYGRGEAALDPATMRIRTTGEGPLPKTSEVFDRVGKFIKQGGEAMGDALSEADDAARLMGGMPAAARWTEADAKIFNEKLLDLQKRRVVMDSTAERMAETYNGDVAAINSANTLKELHGIRKGIDERIGDRAWMNDATKSEVEFFKDLRRTLSKKIEDGMGELAEGGVLSPGTLERWRGANRLLRNLFAIKKPLDEAAGRIEANTNILSLRWRDEIASTAGAIVGSALGGPIGGVAGAATGFASKALQTESGLLWRAEVGEKLRKLAWAEGLMSKSQDDIANAIKGFISGDAAKVGEEIAKKLGPGAYAMTERKTPIERAGSQQAWFDDVRKQIASVAADPQSFAAHQGAQLQGFADAAPNVANAVINKQLQVYAYLSQVMPKNPGMPMSIFNDPWKPADYQIQDFRRVVQVSRAPLTLLTEMRNGTATKSQVEAVKTLYPRIYETVLSQVRAAVNTPGVQLSYPQRLKLGQLFEGIEPTLSADFVNAMQTPASKPDDPMAMPRPPSGPTGFADRRMTSSQRAAAR